MHKGAEGESRDLHDVANCISQTKIKSSFCGKSVCPYALNRTWSVAVVKLGLTTFVLRTDFETENWELASCRL